MLLTHEYVLLCLGYEELSYWLEMVNTLVT